MEKSINNHYLFCSGELFRDENNLLPDGIPPEFEKSVIDTYDLVLRTIPSRAVLLSPGPFPVRVKGGSWTKLRVLLSSPDPLEAGIGEAATRALGLLNWHHNHRFCSRCGSPSIDHPSEIARICPSCKIPVFPRLSPAVIVLVIKEDKILLARHVERNQDIFTCIAGYVEHGETLEYCVEREVAEETGLRVQNIRYVGSQSWPYPDQYMIGFFADWKAGEINVNPSELLEAHWFPRDNLPAYPMPGTVASRLIHTFLDRMSKK